MMQQLRAAFCGVLFLLCAGAPRATAQWQTQSITLKPGWTAVYLYVDASYTNLDYLVGSDSSNPITEVWLWEPNFSTVQYITSAQNPITGSSQWANWERASTGLGAGSTLASLAPNSAFLIHSIATTNYTWNIKGKPTLPSYYWSTTSINFLGFPTPGTNAPLLDAFLGPVPSFSSAATFYQYTGGALSAINPSLIFAPHTVRVNRGQAFWVNSPSYANTYFGPFQVIFNGTSPNYGNSISSTSFRLLNTTPAAVTVNLNLFASENPPSGQQAIVGVPPLVMQGSLNTSNLTYNVTNLSTTHGLRWTLKPAGQAGSDITVQLGVDRTRLAGDPSQLYAGILKFTDSAGLSEVDIPVSAQPASYAGLWVGAAAVSQVSAYLKTYQLDTSGNPVQGSNGAYVVTSVNTNLGATAAAYPLRLILHNDGTNVNLMRRVFYGNDANSNAIVTTVESALDPNQLSTARRVTAVHLPWTSSNATWTFTGRLVPGAALTNLVTTSYADQASNPFLHTYHPDHDNLDATFQNQLPIGAESYQIDRQIILSITPPGNDYASLTQFGKTFSGSYAENVTLTGLAGATRTLKSAGAFTINRLSPIPALTRAQ